MILYLSTFLFFTGFLLVLTAKDPAVLPARPWTLFLHGALAAYSLMLFSYGVLSVAAIRVVSSVCFSGPYTADDLYLYALWALLCSFFCLAVGLAFQLRRNGNHIRFRPVQRRLASGVLAAAVLLFLGAFSIQDYAKTNVRISEVCNRNIDIYPDHMGLYHDYVELYNPTIFPVSARGLYLTDDVEDLPGPVTADALIPAKGYALLLADGEQLSFRLSRDGESLYLLSTDRQVQDMVAVPAMEANAVYARNAVTQAWEVQNATPLQVNAAQQKSDIPLSFSCEGGFYEEAFPLTLSAPEGYRIYYTLDSSTPSETSILYEEPIWVRNVCSEPNVYRAVQRVVKNWADRVPKDTLVDKAFVVRAVAIDGDGNRSDVVTNSYFVDMDRYRDKAVLSLVSDPEGLFGENGIYVTGTEYDAWYTGGQIGDAPEPNFNQKGREYEVETSVELYQDQQRLMYQTAGMRIQGASNRANSLKRLSLYARSSYSGSRYFSYPLFGINTHSFFNRTDLEDALIGRLIQGNGVGGLKSIPAAVFLDGEFWYDTYLREQYNETYLAETFSVSEESVEMVKYMPQELHDFLATHSLAAPANYDALDQIMDIQNYTTFLAANIYMCNMDLSEAKNQQIWRAKDYSGLGYADNRWRFLVYDTDYLHWHNQEQYGMDHYALDSFSTPRPATRGQYNTDPVYCGLKESPRFRQQFVLTFMDLANTCFEKEHVAQVLAEFGQDRTWNRSFFDKRFDYIVPFMAQEFGLTGTLETISLAVNDAAMGQIKINSVTPPILSGGTWTGRYYTDYPITLTAIPEPGYTFVAWRNGDAIHPDSTLQVTLEPGDNLWEAEFRKIGDEQ